MIALGYFALGAVIAWVFYWEGWKRGADACVHRGRPEDRAAGEFAVIELLTTDLGAAALLILGAVSAAFAILGRKFAAWAG
jgi:hypothetical protein